MTRALFGGHLAYGQRGDGDLLTDVRERLRALVVLLFAHGLSHGYSQAASLTYLPRGGTRRGRWGTRPAGQPCRIDGAAHTTRTCSRGKDELRNTRAAADFRSHSP